MNKDEIIREVGGTIFKVLFIITGISLLGLFSAVIIWIWVDYKLALNVFFTSASIFIITAILYHWWKGLIIECLQDRINKMPKEEYKQTTFDKRLKKAFTESN